MALPIRDVLIPVAPGQAVSRGWTDATARKPAGVTWHWTATRDLALCTRLLGGPAAERKGEASAHFGVGRSAAEGIDRYVSTADRSWHAGINQTLRWDGSPLARGADKASRTTIGIETVHVGHARPGVAAAPDAVSVADPTGRLELMVNPWPAEQAEMIIELGRSLIAEWPHIGPEDHHGHSDICPGYKLDPLGFPFAKVLRGIYPGLAVPDLWTHVASVVNRQRLLADLKYDPGPIDGDWGRRSDGALRRFQREHGLLEDGMWTVFVTRRIHALLPRDHAEALFPLQ